MRIDLHHCGFPYDADSRSKYLTVYDVSNRETFDALPHWISEMETYISPAVVKIIVGMSSLPPSPCIYLADILLGNKLDKEYSRAVTEAEGREFADKMGTLFVEASAKTAIGVRETFLELVDKVCFPFDAR